MNTKVRRNDFLGTNTDFEGKLTCEGDIRIDGQFRGEIAVCGTLVVGADASIEANIRAPYVAVAGDIRGNIIADERIEIVSPAKVFGNIEAPRVRIDEGAVFEGNCRMGAPEGTRNDVPKITAAIPGLSSLP